MEWLVWGLLVAGLIVLVAVLLPLVGRLRHNQAEVSSLRATLDEGSGRLRAGQALIRAWRAERNQPPYM